MNKGTVIMVCGLPGAGKTTLAKKFENERSAIRLCADEWIPTLLKDPKDPNDMEEADRLRTPVEHLLLKLGLNLAELGNNVILDNGFWTTEDRNWYRDQIRNAGIKVELHFLDVPLETLWERVNTRNKEEYPFKIESHWLERWHKMFEPPTDEEGESYDYYQKYT